MKAIAVTFGVHVRLLRRCDGTFQSDVMEPLAAMELANQLWAAAAGALEAQARHETRGGALLGINEDGTKRYRGPGV